MKKFLLLIISLLLQFVTAYTQGDSTWSVYNGYSIFNIFPSPDGKYIFCNENDLKRFVKIDAITGQKLDSISGKGIIAAISPDWKYLYTRYGSTFESIKKLDINTYQALDSIDNMQDIKEIDQIHKAPYQIRDMTISSDGKILLGLAYDKYLFVTLDANNLEIIDKVIAADYNRGIDLIGVNKLISSSRNDFLVIEHHFNGFDTLKNMGYDWDETWVWDYKLFKPVKKIFSDSIGGASGARYPLKYMHFSPDGKFFGESRGKFFLYNTIDFLKVKEINNSQAFTFDSKNQFLCIDYSGLFRFIDLNNYLEQCSQSSYYTLALSQDDRFLFGFSAASGYLTKSRTCIYPVGVNEPMPMNDNFIIPNPASDYIEINMPPLPPGEGWGEGIRIFDLLGVEVIQGKDSRWTSSLLRNRGNDNAISAGVVRLDVSSLQPGVYFVRVGNEVRKFVKI